jgi:hypothetical protein
MFRTALHRLGHPRTIAREREFTPRRGVIPMAPEPETAKCPGKQSFPWTSVITVSVLLLALLDFCLIFVVPKLKATWDAHGIVPPAYGRVLILLGSSPVGVTLAALAIFVLVLSLRTRSDG